MVVHHSLSLGALVAFFLYLNRFFAPIQLLVQQYNSFQQGQASILKLRTLLETEPTVTEAPDAVELPPIEGEIVFDDVTFGYDPDVPVLHDVDLRIAPGETVAFVGPTGAGKSTLAKLITRFYDPTAGHVLHRRPRHRGRDAGLAAPPARRGPPGAVPVRRHHPRQPRLRPARGVRRRGGRGHPGGRPHRAGRAAARRASTPSSTSGASPCRRASASSSPWAGPSWPIPASSSSTRPPPTSTCSPRRKIEAALDVLLEARTAVLIAHRLSTAMKADRIVVVDDGRIVEAGTHDELVARRGRYAEMYATWVNQSEHSADAAAS